VAPLDIACVMQAEDLVLWRYHGSSGRLIVCFSGIGRDASQPPPYEFPKVASNGGQDSVLFVSDPNRTWLNGVGLIEKIATEITAFAKETGASELFMMGHSMGGFAAMVMPKFVATKRVVAFAPQFSVHPEIAGEDRRWMEYREKITRFKIRSVAEHLVPGTEYFVFHGAKKPEAVQRESFPRQRNLWHTFLPDIIHHVPQKMKKAGVLEKVVNSCFEGRKRRLRIALEPLKAYRRTAPKTKVKI